MKLNKWRPGYRCTYVIPEIAGNFVSLQTLLKRILPLRKHIGQEDRIVFLGNYLIGDYGGAEVLDTLIALQELHTDTRVCACVRGRDEDLFLKAIKGSEQDYQRFLGEHNGHSVIVSYLNRAGLDSNQKITQARLKDLVPVAHLKFLTELPYYIKFDDYCFFWGGVNLQQTIEENNLNNFVADTSTVKVLNNLITQGRLEAVEKLPALQECVCIASHNADRKSPFVSEKWMSLAIGAPNNLGCFDLESMEMIRIKRGRERPYKLEI